jgi:hypothetical protein
VCRLTVQRQSESQESLLSTAFGTRRKSLCASRSPILNSGYLNLLMSRDRSASESSSPLMALVHPAKYRNKS